MVMLSKETIFWYALLHDFHMWEFSPGWRPNWLKGRGTKELKQLIYLSLTIQKASPKSIAVTGKKGK